MKFTKMYEEFNRKDLSMRDWLAIDRTILANQRTLLSFLGTGLGFSGLGITLIKVFPDSKILPIIAIMAFVCASIAIYFGITRFVHFRKLLKSIKNPKAFPCQKYEE